MIGSQVGIDIQEDAVVAVRVARGARRETITAVASVPIAESGGIGKAIAALREQINWENCRCVSVVPAGHLAYRNLKMPFASAKKIAQTLPYELETMLPGGVDWGVVDFVVVAQGEHADVMAVVAERAFLGEYLAQLRESGVDPVILDVRTAALALCLCSGTGAPQDALLLELGRHTGTLTVISQRRIALIREIVLAGNEEAVAERLEATIQNTLRGFRSETGLVWNPAKVFVTGSRSGDAGMVRVIGESLALPVEKADLARRAALAIAAPVAARWDGARMDAALALALGGGRRAGTFNFRREEFALQHPYLRYRRELGIAGGYAALLLLLLAVNFGVEYYALSKQSSLLQQRLVSLFRQTLPEVTRVVDPVQQLQVKIKELGKTAVAAPDSLAAYPVVEVMAEISARIPKSAEVRVTRFSMDRDGVRVTGETDNFNTVDTIKKELDASPLFKEVSISSANLDRSGQMVRFELRIL